MLSSSSSSSSSSPSLSSATVGQRVQIIRMTATSDEQRRLCELGLCCGTTLDVVGRMGGRGALVVSVHGSRMVVGPDVADRIKIVTL